MATAQSAAQAVNEHLSDAHQCRFWNVLCKWQCLQPAWLLLLLLLLLCLQVLPIAEIHRSLLTSLHHLAIGSHLTSLDLCCIVSIGCSLALGQDVPEAIYPPAYMVA